MSKTNSFETELAQLIFNNTALANIGDASGLQPSSGTNFYVRLYVSGGEPTDSGGGVEATYTGYSMQTVVRSGSGWTVSGNNTSNAATIQFGSCTANPQTVTAVGITNDNRAPGTGTILLYWALLDNPVVVNIGVNPTFAIGQLDINED